MYLVFLVLCVLYIISTRHGFHSVFVNLCRDADETKEWIEEKNQTLNNDDTGNDLSTVQRLQRKHEGLERDLAALNDKVRDLDETANR